MTTMWIILGVAAVATVFWRLSRASAKLNQILHSDVPGGGAPSEPESLPASHDR